MRAAALVLALAVVVPAWQTLASDTDLIAYFHGTWGDINIYTIPTAGGTPTQLTANVGNNLDPEWSPDGAKIAFQSDRDGYAAIYVMNADGSEQIRLTPSGVTAGEPFWSADGTQILFTSSRGVSIMNADGSGRRQLVDSVLGWNAKTSRILNDRIVFETQRDGDAEIYIMNWDGTEIRRLTENSVDDQHPALSPDGQWIAFNSSLPGRQDFDLFVMRVDGTDVRQLTGLADHEEYATWSPDGTQLAYAYGNAAIYIIHADGTGRRRLTSSGFWTGGPAWRPAIHD